MWLSNLSCLSFMPLLLTMRCQQEVACKCEVAWGITIMVGDCEYGVGLRLYGVWDYDYMAWECADGEYTTPLPHRLNVVKLCFRQFHAFHNCKIQTEKTKVCQKCDIYVWAKTCSPAYPPWRNCRRNSGYCALDSSACVVAEACSSMYII